MTGDHVHVGGQEKLASRAVRSRPALDWRKAMHHASCILFACMLCMHIYPSHESMHTPSPPAGMIWRMANRVSSTRSWPGVRSGFGAGSGATFRGQGWGAGSGVGQSRARVRLPRFRSLSHWRSVREGVRIWQQAPAASLLSQHFLPSSILLSGGEGVPPHTYCLTRTASRLTLPFPPPCVRFHGRVSVPAGGHPGAPQAGAGPGQWQEPAP